MGDSNLDSCSIDGSLDLLRQFLASDAGCIRFDRTLPGEAGRCNLDGRHFFDRFVLFLQDKQIQSVPDTLTQIERILVLSGFVRNGGVKAMMYRLETGCRSVVNDYLDDISQRLHLHAHQFVTTGNNSETESKEKHDCRHSADSLLLLLRTVNADQEEQVAAKQNEINNLLIEISRRLDGEVAGERAESVVQSQK